MLAVSYTYWGHFAGINTGIITNVKILFRNNTVNIQCKMVKTETSRYQH